MKRLYLSAFALLIFKSSFGSYSYNSSHSYGNNSSHDSSSSYQQVKQEPKQEEKTSYEKSFEYAQQQFSTYDTRSHQLVGDTVDTLKTTKDPHEYSFNLGLYMALATTREAERAPQHTASILKASFSLVDPQAEIRYHLGCQRPPLKTQSAQVSSHQNIEKTATVAQKVSNFFVSLIQGFKEQAKKVDLCNEVSGLESMTRAHQFSGVKHIKEMMSKFSQLSPEGKKAVGSLVLAGNMPDALKVISVGDKGVIYYRNTRQNNVEGANPLCRVEKSDVREGEPSFLSPDSFKFKEVIYRFDCPTNVLPSSYVAESNNRCAYNLYNKELVCPKSERPFDIKRALHPFKVLSLSHDRYNGERFTNKITYDYANKEVAAARRYLNSFRHVRDTFTPEARTYLYAQALLIAQDIFGVEPLSVSCLADITGLYQREFGIYTGPIRQITKEDIKKELSLAREYLRSHVLFEKDIPEGFDNNKFQYAQALHVMAAVAANYGDWDEVAITMPDKNVLEKKLHDLGIDSFAEKTNILDDLAGKIVNPSTVALALDRAINASTSRSPGLFDSASERFLEPERILVPHEQSLDRGDLNSKKQQIIESLLSEYPEAIESLERRGTFK